MDFANGVTVTPADVRARASELQDETDDRINAFLEDAALWVNQGYWGPKFKLALILMCAHLLTQSRRASAGQGLGAVGAVVSESVGEVSRTYAAPAAGSDPSAAELGSTTYGITYLNLRRTLGTTPRVV